MVNAICRPYQIALDFGKGRLDTEGARGTAGGGGMGEEKFVTLL